MFGQFIKILRKPAFYQISAALMFCGAATAYLYVRFGDFGSMSDLSSMVEVFGVLFLIMLLCTLVLHKCSLELKKSTSTASVTSEDLDKTMSRHHALVLLAQSRNVVEGDLSGAAQEITELVSGSLAVGRVSIWLVDDDSVEIRCLDLYSSSSDSHSIGNAIRISDYSEYFQILDGSRTIDVAEAQTDNRTESMVDGFLAPFDVRSIINSCIRVNGRVVGYVFIGNVGEIRNWSDGEASFVAATADIFAQVIANDEKLKMLEAIKRVTLTTSVVTGEKFLDSLVCELCSTLKVDFSMITKWSNKDRTKMKSLALAGHCQLQPAMEYELAGTPCDYVVSQGLLHVAENAIAQYPNDKEFAEMGIESYMGAPLRDSQGDTVGILNIFHTKRIQQPDTARHILEIFAGRVAIELDRIKILEEISSSEALLNATLDSATDGLLVTSVGGNVKLANKSFAELWGFPHDEIDPSDDRLLLKSMLSQLVDPERFLDKVKALNDSEKVDFDVLFFKDGRMFERYSRPLIMEGVRSGRVWSFRDITVKERAVASLQESEDRYHSIFDSSNDGLTIFDDHMNIKEVNRAMCRMHGWSEDEFLRLSPSDLIHEDSKPLFQEFMECLSRNVNYNCIAKDVCKDGSVIDVEVSGFNLLIGDQIHYLAVTRDITDRKRRERKEREMQDKLERAERMQSIGVLAGGVAHDLNNILGPLVAYPELILMKLPEDSPLRERISLIGSSAKHAADVIQDLLTLSRRGRVELRPDSVNKVINDFLLSTNFVNLERVNPKVKLEVKLADELASISASQSHLTKAILNLCSNSYAVMPDGGQLTIETSQVYLESLSSGSTVKEPGNYISLRVSDTGEGMTKEHLKKIFEPYYNKKNVVSSSSGLGLAIVYGVIKDHGGYYDVISEPGKGTEFVIYLPAISEEVQTEYLKPSNYGGTETVLVVDDDESQRNLACALLESLGYDVDSAFDGLAGVETLSSRSADLVVLDMIMEDGFDGLDTYRAMLEINPHQKAVIVSGFAATDRVDEIHRLGAGSYVKKPYTRDAIGKAVRETLDSPVSQSVINT